MAARFIIGLAGTGKTRHCTDALAQASQADPLGPPLFWLVPQQATFISEQRLLSCPDLAGTFRVQVLGFNRFCRNIAPQLGLESTPDLSNITRMLLLAQTVEQCRDKLVLFQNLTQQPGFLRSLNAILRELQQAGHDHVSLTEVRRTLTMRNQADDILNRKLSDFITLLTAWQQHLGASRGDPDLLPQLVADRLSTSAAIAASSVWLDSFSTLSMVEINLITALAKCCQNVDITLLANPESPVFHTPDAPPEPLSTFHRTQVMYRRLQTAFAKAQVAIAPPVLLTHSHRFAAAPELLSISHTLFLPPPQNPPADAAPVDSPQASATATASSHTDDTADFTPGNAAATLWECDTPESEIQAAAEFIHQQITSHKLRYRDIGIVVADIESYEAPIRRIFAAHHIPIFIDRRRPITDHPLVELLRGAVNLVQDNFRQADWLALLKTGLAALPDEDTFILENYLLTRGIDRDDFSRPWLWSATESDENAPVVPPSIADLAALNQANTIRHQVHQNLSAWFAAAHAQTSYTQKIHVLRSLLDTLQVRMTLQTWIESASAAGQPELALIHQQAWQEVLNLLEAMEKLPTAGASTLVDFSALFNTGLETLTLGLIPPALDQVLVSSADRSRHPELHTVIILGSVETRFPQVIPEDPMLDDRQRELFNAAGQAPIGSGSRQNLLEAPFLDYVAFTRAAQRLILSYPAVNTSGDKVIASRYVQALQHTLPVVPINAGNNHLYRWSCSDDLLAGLMRWTSSHAVHQESSSSSAPMTLRQVQALYHWLTSQADPATRAAARQVFTALNPCNSAQLSATLASTLHPGALHISASQLECFCRCPQQHFFTHILRLQPRRNPDMDALAMGLVYHQTLQEVFASIIRGELPWPQCSRDALMALLEKQMEAAFCTIETKMFARSPQSQALRRPVRRNLQALLTREHLAAQTTQLRPHLVEAAFGLESAVLSPLRLASPGTHAIVISGKIDRLDVSKDGHAIVLDYKSGPHAFKLYRAAAGIDIQLLVYLLVLKEPKNTFNGKPYRGFGAFYQPLKFDPKGSEPLAPEDPVLYASLKPSGFFVLDDFPLLEPMPHPGDPAKWFKLRINKNGSPHKKINDSLILQEMQNRLDEAKNLILTVADLIAQGYIQPHPFKDGNTSACTWCDFQSACPFDRLTGRYRNIRQQSGAPGPAAPGNLQHSSMEDP